MYKQVPTDKSFQWNNGSNITPVATLADSSGGRAQIVIDDGCYLIMLKRPNGRYQVTSWIFEEAFDVLKKLPSLNRYPEVFTPRINISQRISDYDR